MLKNAFFFTVKIASASGDPHPDLLVITSAYCYSFVEFISSAK